MPNNRHLNTELKQWSKRIQASTPAPKISMDRIQQRAEQDAPTISLPNRPVLSFPLLRAAALVVLGIGLSLWFAYSFSPTETSHDTAAVSEPELEELSTVYREMSRLFDDRPVWMVDSGKSITMNVLNAPSHPEPHDPVLIRLNFQRLQKNNQWHSEWTKDIVTSSTAMVDFHPPSSDEDRFYLWAYPLEPGIWNLEYEWSLAPHSLPTKAADIIDLAARDQASETLMLNHDTRLVRQVIQLPLLPPPETRG